MKREGSIEELLISHGLKRTPIRIQILELFANSTFAQSARDLLAKMNKGQDRVTVYRALAAFEKQGIIHKASEDGHGIRYAMYIKDKKASEKHAHFVCDECQRTYCLNDIKIPEIKVPEEFMINRANYVLNGICGSCRH